MTTNKNERVEEYLRNKMTESEKSAFQFELMQDKNLRQELKSMRIVQKTLIADSKRGSIGQNSPSYWKWLLPLLFLPVLYLLWNKTDVVVVPPETPKTEEVSPVVPKEEINTDSPPNTEPKISVEKEEEKEQKSIKKTEQNSPIPKIQKPQQPIAMANYEPNALLEALINNNKRGAETTFTIEHRQGNVSLEKAGASTDFYVSGKVESEGDLSESAFKLYIFSNELEEYRAFLPKYTQQIVFAQKEDIYHFELQTNLSLQPGLYYYIIEDTKTEEQFFVEKFKIELE